MNRNDAGALVRVEHLSKTFPGQRALIDVSLTIAPHEIHALVGENGSGKSTLIKVLAGFHDPDPGSRITVADEPLVTGSAASARRLGLRFVHQDLGLVDQLSAADNVGLASGFVRGPGGRIRWRQQQDHARRLLAKVGADIDVRRPVAELRPVDRSTIAIARALDETQGRIRLLVLDEPTAALPPTEVETLFRTLREVLATGVSILYVSHRLDEILGLADRVSVLRDGRFQGTVPVAGLERSELVELIVGAEQSEHVRASLSAGAHRVHSTGDVAFRVRGLTAERLAGVDLDIGRGEILGIAGLTGSGREEFAAAIAGAQPASFTLSDATGHSWQGLTPRRARSLGIALVLANRHPASAVRQFTMGENISLPMLHRYTRGARVDPKVESAQVHACIQELDIRPTDPDRQYAMLSGGNQQKTIFAKWLNTSPSLLVMDDPTSGVDIGARHAIYELIRAQATRGVPVLICSSDIEDFVGVCDRVIVLVGGHIETTLTGADVEEGQLLDAILRAAQSVPHPSPTGDAA